MAVEDPARHVGAGRLMVEECWLMGPLRGNLE